MNAKERLIRTMTFQTVDKIPLSPGGPRQSTLRRWRAEGLPEGADYMQEISRIIGVTFEPGAVGLPVDMRMRPWFEEKVLKHEDGHYLVQDWMGAIVEISDEFDVTFLRVAKDFVTRKWHKCPVENRAEWAEMKKRYDSEDDTRLAGVAEASAKAAAEGRPLFMSINGPFWQMREWLGFEGLCFAAADDPEWVDEMAEFWMNYIDRILEKLVKIAVPDHVMINEDMAYKAHAMISPAMTRRFVLPAYEKWMKRLCAAGLSIFDVDSDGYVGTLLPLWIASGVNCNSPLEVAAHNDIVEYSRLYGGKMGYRGGIDKRCIAAGGDVMRAELMRVAPVIKRGGYIPGCDHGVPPDISWSNFIAYTKLLAQLTGWL